MRSLLLSGFTACAVVGLAFSWSVIPSSPFASQPPAEPQRPERGTIERASPGGQPGSEAPADSAKAAGQLWPQNPAPRQTERPRPGERGPADRDRWGSPGGMAGPPGFGRPGGFGGPGGPGTTQEIRKRFDEDRDGILNQAERARARTFLTTSRPDRPGMFDRRPGGPGGPFSGPAVSLAEDATPTPGDRLSPDDVTHYPDGDLYDPQTLRTLFFNFENEDWEQELEDFHRTDVEVPATLIVDGQTYPNVGLRFRGNSSYNVPRGKKRSFNVALDLVDNQQRLRGYKTLNLLNSHSDPSFLRVVLYNHLARQYLPAPRANLVRVVINGESWGIYVNEEQFNKDFARTWFGEDAGSRWKVPPNFSGAAALVYHGENVEDYRRLYEVKAKDEDQAWRDLIELCRQLEQLPNEQLESQLDRLLNVDRALWFLALDNVLLDEDGYFSRGSDYSMYQDAQFKRFHILPRDSNETFRLRGGPGGPGGPGGGPGGPGRQRPGGPAGRQGGGPDASGPRPADEREWLDEFDLVGGPGFGGPGFPRGPGFPGGPGFGGPGFGGPGFGGPGFPGGPGGVQDGDMQAPLSMLDSPVRPLIRRLLSNAPLRARYLAHVRTLVDEALDWTRLGPVFEDYRALVAEDVLADTRKLSTFEAFIDSDIAEAMGGGPFGSPIGLKRFCELRREFLAAHPDLAAPRPAIVSVAPAAEPQPDKPLRVVAQVSREVPVEAVLLYYAVGRNAPFQTIAMTPAPDQSAAGARPPHAEPAAGMSNTSGATDLPPQSYTAEIPPVSGGCEVAFYVEARAPPSLGTTVFCPARTELGAVRVQLPGG